MSDERELRAQVAKRMCDSCACRPGTFANQCDVTREWVDTHEIGFKCHAGKGDKKWFTWDGPNTPVQRISRMLDDAAYLPPCAGALARHGTVEQLERFLADPPDVRHEYGILIEGSHGVVVSDFWTPVQVAATASKVMDLDSHGCMGKKFVRKKWQGCVCWKERPASEVEISSRAADVAKRERDRLFDEVGEVLLSRGEA